MQVFDETKLSELVSPYLYPNLFICFQGISLNFSLWQPLKRHANESLVFILQLVAASWVVLADNRHVS